MKKIAVIFLLFLSISCFSQTYQIESCSIQQTQDSWTKWMPISAEITSDFELKIITIRHEESFFQFKIIEIGQILKLNNIQYLSILTLDIDQRAHSMIFVKDIQTSMIIFQIDDYTNHKIQYKIK